MACHSPSGESSDRSLAMDSSVAPLHSREPYTMETESVVFCDTFDWMSLFSDRTGVVRADTHVCDLVERKVCMG